MSIYATEEYENEIYLENEAAPRKLELIDFSLWDHQLRTYHAIRASIARGNKRIVAYMPTGAGKSRLMAAITGMALAKNKKVGFYVNRKSLVDQFGKTLQDFEITYDILQADNTWITNLPVQVCSIQTVARRGWFEQDIILIDECHYVPGSKDYLKLIHAHPDTIILGLTATPFAHGMSAHHPELDGPLFQDLIVETDVQELIREGVLVDVDMYAPSSPDMTGVKVGRNQFGEQEYNQKETEKRVNKIELIGDIYDHWRSHASHMKTIGFAHSIPHSKALSEMFQRRGVRCGHIDSYMDDDERAEQLRRYKNNEDQVLWNVALMKEGVDIPSMECLILAKPVKSITTWLQMSGRILRAFPGKLKGLILDHSGSAWELGWPSDPLPLKLHDGTKEATAERKESMEKKEKSEVLCPMCKAIKKSLICDKCGFEVKINPNVTVKHGKLEKLTRKQELSLDSEKLYAELQGLATDRKWKGNKAKVHFKEITGQWPNGMDHIRPAPASEEVKKMVTYNNIKYTKSKHRRGVR